VGHVVNTHSHEDHIGANAQIAHHHGVSIAAHPLGLPVMAAPHLFQPLKPYQRLLWGYPKAAKGETVGETVETEKYNFKVILHFR